ncbi:MAG: hypothetical protein ACI8RD_002688 [Bacillariaceae sp.]|jgi:hypothetical protein
MSDLGDDDGGETVFPQGMMPKIALEEEEAVSSNEVGQFVPLIVRMGNVNLMIKNSLMHIQTLLIQ